MSSAHSSSVLSSSAHSSSTDSSSAASSSTDSLLAHSSSTNSSLAHSSSTDPSSSHSSSTHSSSANSSSTHSLSTNDNDYQDTYQGKKLYSHPKSQKSFVWDYYKFTMLDEEDEIPTLNTLDMTRPICIRCHFIPCRNTSNTTNLQKHLKKHNIFAPKPSEDVPSDQPQISNFIKTDIQMEGTEALVKLFAKKILPLSLVDNEYFRKFVGTICPNFKLPCRNTLLDKLQKKCEEIGKLIKIHISL